MDIKRELMKTVWCSHIVQPNGSGPGSVLLGFLVCQHTVAQTASKIHWEVQSRWKLRIILNTCCMNVNCLYSQNPLVTVFPRIFNMRAIEPLADEHF